MSGFIALQLCLAALSTFTAADDGQPEGVNKTTAPWFLPYAPYTVGPDGPWNVIALTVDYPPRKMLVYPGGAKTSLWIDADACVKSDIPCPRSPIPMWTPGNGTLANNGDNSTERPVRAWDSTVYGPMNLTGTGAWGDSRVILQSSIPQNNHLCWGHGAGWCYLSASAKFATSDITVNYPGGPHYSYTPNIGLLSLAASSTGTSSWVSVAGAPMEKNQSLPEGYNLGYYPSLSYGLHIGAARFNQKGSLWLGGYDRSRSVGDPIVSSSDYVKLRDIGLGVHTGASPFYHAPSGEVRGILSKATRAQPIKAYPNPAVPYMYLPASVCRIVAHHLPIYYNSKVNLYLWNTADPVYNKLMSTSAYMYFEFESESSPSRSTIYVPMLLLNMSLTPPLATKDIPYFPCSPYEPAPDDQHQQYHLGRAFLQAAILAQIGAEPNRYTILNQAPGPSQAYYPDPVKIDNSDTTIQRVKSNNPDYKHYKSVHFWHETWSHHFNPLKYWEAVSSKKYDPEKPKVHITLDSGPSRPNTAAASTSTSSSASSSSSTGLSAGEIAAVVIAIIAAIFLAITIALIIIIRNRRRQRQEQEKEAMRTKRSELRASDDSTLQVTSPQLLDEKYTVPRKEMPGCEAAHEVPATVELEGDTCVDLEKPLPPLPPPVPPNTTNNSAIERSVERNMKMEWNLDLKKFF